MNAYLTLLRGINVGGKNKIPMEKLKLKLIEFGFKNVNTYIQSGNLILESHLDKASTGKSIESILAESFKLDSSVKALVLNSKQLNEIIKNKPEGFGENPKKYHSDVIFLININSDNAMSVFSPKEGVDKVWPGTGVIYSQRLSSKRTQSRLNKIVGSKYYQNMTIRNWNTTTKLQKILEDFENK